jgi:hypothetical protein
MAARDRRIALHPPRSIAHAAAQSRRIDPPASANGRARNQMIGVRAPVAAVSAAAFPEISVYLPASLLDTIVLLGSGGFSLADVDL